MKDHSSYDLFKCPACGKRFMRRSLSGTYPNLACPLCKAVIPNSNCLVDESDEERIYRVTSILLETAKQELNSAITNHKVALQDYLEAVRVIKAHREAK